MTARAAVSYGDAMWRFGRIGAVAGVWLALHAASARAEDAGAGKARLAGLLRKGAEAAKAQQWEACIQALGEAAAIEETPRTAGDLGLCEEQAGRFAEAHRHLRRALESAPADRKAQPWKSYQAALARAAERVAVLFVTVTPPEAAVVLDGRPLGKADGRHIAVTPGTHTLTARLAGHEDATETRTMRARDVPHVHLELKPKASPAAGERSAPSAAAGGAPAVPAASTKGTDTATSSRAGTASGALTSAGAATVAGTVTASPDSGATAPARRFPCLPGPGASGVLLPMTCLSGALLVLSASTAIAFEVHATSLRNTLVERGFRIDSCAPGQPAAGSAACDEMANRQVMRDASLDVMLGTGAAAFMLGSLAVLALASDASQPKVTVTAGARGGGITVLGTW